MNYLIENENSTLGNLLQTYLLKHPNVIMASYRQEHPTINNIQLFIQAKDNNENEILKEVIDQIIKDVENLRLKD